MHVPGHVDHFDVSTLEGRTAAARTAAMIQERIRRVTGMLQQARAMGRQHEVVRCQHELAELAVRRDRILLALSSTPPLAGLAIAGGFGAAMTSVPRAAMNVEEAEDRLREITSEIEDLDQQVQKIAASPRMTDRVKIKSMRKLRQQLLARQAEAVKGVKQAHNLAANPEGTAQAASEKMTQVMAEEGQLRARLPEFDKEIVDISKTINAAPLLRRAALRKKLEAKKNERAAFIKRITALAKESKALQATSTNANLYAKLKQNAVRDLATSKVRPVVPGQRLQHVAHPGLQTVKSGETVAVTPKDKVRIDGLNRRIAAITSELRGLSEHIQAAVASGKDPKAVIVMIGKARSLSDTLRALTFQRDQISRGIVFARAERVRHDEARVYATQVDIRNVEQSNLPAAGKMLLLNNLGDYLRAVMAQLEESRRQISSVAAGKVMRLPRLREIGAGQLRNAKRQLALSPRAGRPSTAMIGALAVKFSQCLPPKPGESAEAYLLRIKRYVARGAVVAANAEAQGTPTATAVEEAVKDVVVNDAPAIEEEAAANVTAPAGEEAVASVVNENLDVVVAAATAVAPETMAAVVSPEVPQTQTELAIEEQKDQPATAAVEELAAEVLAVETAQAAAPTTSVDAAPEASMGDANSAPVPWYKTTKGMIGIGIVAFLGYRALTSEE